MSAQSDRIKSLRSEYGYTLRELADQVGVTETTMQRYESGQIKNIKKDILMKLADVFHCSPGYILGWEGERDLEPSDMDPALDSASRFADMFEETDHYQTQPLSLKSTSMSSPRDDAYLAFRRLSKHAIEMAIAYDQSDRLLQNGVRRFLGLSEIPASTKSGEDA